MSHSGKQDPGKQSSGKQSSGKKADPYAKREAKNYDNPIPSREFILDLLAEQPESISSRKIIEVR